MTKRPIIILSGPTAVGKTALSIALAKMVNGSIISADSMQVYKYMDIGSAKITKEEMDGVTHYLVDELMPEEEFNIVRFQQMAKEAMEEIYAQGKIPVIVGGTGFYIQALLYDINFDNQDCDEAYRKELEVFANEHGNEALHEKLKEVDPISAEIIHANNVKRVIRALEFYKLTGKPISLHNEEEHRKESPYNHAYFVLTDKRELLYERIDKRVDRMIEQGLLEEVAKLKEHMTDVAVTTKASMDFYHGKLNGKEVVIVRSGIGKVNAAICTQILVDDYKVSAVINTGIAGSLRNEINIGDIVLSTDALEHDMEATAFGYPVGQIPRMDTFAFPADKRLVELAVLANKEANPNIQTFTGRVVSGDQFISSNEDKERLVSVFGGKCAEMEGASIAHVAYLNKVACIIIRAISDKADNSATMDYPEFEKRAIAQSVKLMKNCIICFFVV